MVLFDPEDFNARENMLSDHPVLRKAFVAFTPTISAVYTQIRDLIWLGRPSAYFYSTPRMGKSQCAKAIKYLACLEFPNKYIVLLSCDTTGEENIVQSLALALSLCKRNRETCVKLRERIVTHIMCELASVDGTHFLLILDELQALDEKSYRHLQYLQNRLKLYDLSMTTIGFAQIEINGVRGSLVLAKETALVARFLSQRFEFIGCSTREWLEGMLQSFDDHLVYPPDTTCSYTKFFVPKAYASGFRLYNYAGMIFDCAVDAVADSARKVIPVAHLFSAVEFLLISSRLEDSDHLVLNSDIVSSAIQESGMSEFARLMGAFT